MRVLSIHPLLNSEGTDQAKDILARVAAQVEPIMERRSNLGWRCLELLEFFPENEGLLGMNVNRGAKIYLRLRPAGSPPKKKQALRPVTGSNPRTLDDLPGWLSFESVLDTMLHELAHNSISPHNDAFQQLWDQLRKECEGDIAANRGGSPQAYGGTKNSLSVGVGSVYGHGATPQAGGSSGTAAWQGEGRRLSDASPALAAARGSPSARRAAAAAAAELRARRSALTAGSTGGVRLGGGASEVPQSSMWSKSAWAAIRRAEGAAVAEGSAAKGRGRGHCSGCGVIDLTVDDEEADGEGGGVAPAASAASGKAATSIEAAKPRATRSGACTDRSIQAVAAPARPPVIVIDDSPGRCAGVVARASALPISADADEDTDEVVVVADAGMKRRRGAVCGDDVASARAVTPSPAAAPPPLPSAAVRPKRKIVVIELDEDGNELRMEKET